jgi:hypothetical protein
VYPSNDCYEKWVVFGHILRRPPIFRAYKAIAKHTDYFEHYDHIKLALELVMDFEEEFGGQITKDCFLLDWDLALAESDLDYSEFIQGQIHLWFDKPEEEFSDDYVRKILENLHQTSVATRLKSELDLYETTPDKAKEAVRKASDRISSSLFTDMVGRNPFDDLETNMAVAELCPWGVDFMDVILGGGSAAGEMVGVLMVSGGGKTTLGVQILAAHVRRKEHIVYFSTEQDLAGDMTIRMLCHALGCTRDDVKTGVSRMTPQYRKRIPEVKKDWETYCHFIELAHKPIMSINSLFEYVQQLNDRGIYPTSIIIDWWGRLKDALVETNLNNGASEADIRRSSRSWLHTLRSRGGEFGLKTLVLHQLSGQVAERSHAHRPSSHSAQEDKNFNNMFDYCFTASRKDEDDECDFIADKARKGGNDRRRIRLDGLRCRFEAVGNPNDTSMVDDDDDDFADIPITIPGEDDYI